MLYIFLLFLEKMITDSIESVGSQLVISYQDLKQEEKKKKKDSVTERAIAEPENHRQQRINGILTESNALINFKEGIEHSVNRGTSSYGT